MARIIPEGWREMSAFGAVQREIETLQVLAAGLPDDYTVYLSLQGAGGTVHHFH